MIGCKFRGQFDRNKQADLFVICYEDFYMALKETLEFSADLKSNMTTTTALTSSLILDTVGVTCKKHKFCVILDMDTIWNLWVWCQSNIKDARHHRTWFNIGPYYKCMFCWKALLHRVILHLDDAMMVLHIICDFCVDLKSKINFTSEF